MTGKPGERTGAAVKVPAGWVKSADGSRMSLHVKAKDFVTCLGVVNEVALAAEDLQHHPDLHLTSYNHLLIETYSHDIGGLSERDERLAERVNGILAGKKLKPSPRGA